MEKGPGNCQTWSQGHSGWPSPAMDAPDTALLFHSRGKREENVSRPFGVILLEQMCGPAGYSWSCMYLCLSTSPSLSACPWKQLTAQVPGPCHPREDVAGAPGSCLSLGLVLLAAGI